MLHHVKIEIIHVDIVNKRGVMIELMILVLF